MKPRELSIPEQTATDSSAFEILRVWIVDGNQVVNIKVEAWDDPAAWGLLLADLARHIAHAYADLRKDNSSNVLSRIWQGFDVEMRNPTDNPSGGLVE